MDFFAEHLRPAGGTLVFRGTVVGNHCPRGTQKVGKGDASVRKNDTNCNSNCNICDTYGDFECFFQKISNTECVLRCIYPVLMVS